MSMDNACSLLYRQASGERLSDVDATAMLNALGQHLRRDPVARRWSRVRDGDHYLQGRVHEFAVFSIEDTIQDFLEDVVAGKWPRLGEGKGRVQTVTTALLAAELNNRLRHVFSAAVRDAEHLQKPTGQATDDDPSGVEALAAPSDEDFRPKAGGGPEQDTIEDTLRDNPDRVTAAFELRCLRAARLTVEQLDDDGRQLIDVFLAPQYLENTDVAGNVAARQLGLPAPTFTRRLQSLGLRLAKEVIEQGPSNAQAHWLTTPIGRYLAVGCGVRPGQPDRWDIAMQTLCACNSEHLDALKR